MFQVIKRDGEVAEFMLGKVSDAIIKAFDATDVQYNKDIVDLLSLRVSAEFQGKIADGKGFYPVPETEGENAQHEVHHSRLQGCGKQLREGGGLACKGKFHRDVLRGRIDFKQFGRSDGELLAVRNL